MDACSSNVFEAIAALKPRSILDVVPRAAFREIDDPKYAHIGNGDCFEWKYAIAKYLQPITILEIGVRYGYSAASFASGSQALVYFEGWDNEIYEPGSNTIATQALDVIRLLQPAEEESFDVHLRKVDSQDMTQLVRCFDLVHIDSSHTYNGCLHDLRLCAGMTKAILVDDTLTCPDDMRAVASFAIENEGSIKELIHIHSHVGEALILLK